MQVDVNSLFARAEAAFRDGRLDAARSDLLTVCRLAAAHPAVLHLLALVEQRAGRLGAARQAFLQAIAAAPTDPQIHNNYANLLSDQGGDDAALRHYGRALAAAPGFVDALVNRGLLLTRLDRDAAALADFDKAVRLQPRNAAAHGGRAAVLRKLARLDEAAAAYDAALALSPNRKVAVHGRARIALERGDADAVPRYAAAASLLPQDGDVAIGEAEALEAAGAPAPDRRLAAMVAARPDWAEGHRVLARMRWEAGDRTGFTQTLEDALVLRPRDAALWTTLIEALAGADLFATAADAAARARAALGDAPEMALREAIHAGEAGDDARAEALFATLAPDHPGRALHEARHRIRLRQFTRAADLLDAVCASDDANTGAWALTWLVWRVLGDARADWLHGQPGLVGPRQLGLDEGEIARTAAVLRSLHRTNTHPIGQSLRGGTQTRGRLFDRREPEIVRLRDAIRDAVQAHWSGLPPADPRHPLLRHRARTPHFTDSWSVRLVDAGFHVAHIHPHGALSSASYLVLPPAGGEDGEAGWLEIGRPPADLRLDLPPLATIEPEPGRLALFPSTLYHGTRPFSSGERITVAFDVAV